jgi:hypothetical protein
MMTTAPVALRATTTGSGKACRKRGATARIIAVAPLMLLHSLAKAQKPPEAGCVNVTKTEYESAYRNKISNRHGYYERTREWLRLYYWYCSAYPATTEQNSVANPQRSDRDSRPAQTSSGTYAGYSLDDWVRANSQ